MNWIFLALGLSIGAIVSFVFNKKKPVGTLEMDMTNSKEPYLRLLMDNDNFVVLHNKKYVVFRVDSTATFTRQKHSL